MSEEYSIKFWLFWLTFVSIHHSNSNNHRQLMNTHAAALSAGAKFETAAVRQEQLPHWLSPKGIKEPAAGELFTASTAIKQVIGDVVIDEQQLKEQQQQNQQYSTLAHVDNVQQHSHATLLNSKASSHRNGIFQDEEEYLDETEQSEKEFLKQLLNDVQRKDKIKTKISLQQLLRQHEETIKKFNDTGGQYAEQELHISSSDNIVNGPSPVLTDEEEEQLTLDLLESILKADMANVPAIPNDTNRFKPTKNSNKIEVKNLKRYPNKQQTIDSLDQELKENLQKFLKISKIKEEIIEQPENKDYKPLVASSSDISTNLVASNTTYTAAAVATTKKRNAPIIATTTTTPHNLNNLTRIISSAASPFSSLSVSPFSSKPSYYMFAKTAADVTTPSAATTNTILISGNAATASTADVHSLSTKSIQQQQHVTPMERRHIIPEKLHYTREIAIKQGRLMGIKRNFHAFSGLRDVDQYLGLPYAEAPTGSRRFMPPGAPLPWQGLKIAHHLPPVCPQKLPDISLQGSSKMSKGRYKHLTRLLPYLKTESEDCLYLNVYVPSDGVDGIHASFAEDDDDDSYQQQQHLYPVIVYIHGESFEWNSGNAYDGGVLASYGEVIVVTVNYRLGILGFMRPSINENTVANFGLLDQIAALHWIKENIGYFGGDKDKVTLMGHTTGAACINYLMVSPVASGLFHRAVLMSGSAMSDWAATNHSLQLTMQIAHALNCPLNDDNEEMLSCLRQKRHKGNSRPIFFVELG